MSKKNKSKKQQMDKNRMIKSEHVLNVGDETILVVETEKTFLPVGEIIKEIKEEIEENKKEINDEIMKNVKEGRAKWSCVIC